MATLSSASPACDPVGAAATIGALYHQGRYREALHAAGAALRNEPRNAALWNVGAAAAFALNLLADAERFWNVAIAHDPACAQAHSNLGMLHARGGDLDAAQGHLTRAISLDPGDARALSNLGAVLVESRRYEQALRVIERSIALAGESPEALSNLGLALMNLGRTDEARASLQRALALQPGFPGALLGSAQLHLHEGNEEAATREFESLLAVDPVNAKAHLFKSEQSSASDGAWVKQLQAAFHRRSGRPLREVIQLDFAMGKVYEDLARHEEAFEAYSEGNGLHYTLHPFDEELAERRFMATIGELDAQLYARALAERQPQRAAPAARIPIFVVGMPRSGTTLLEQILASHPDVLGAGELTVLPELLAAPVRAPMREGLMRWLDQLRDLGGRYLSSAWESRPQPSFVVDKLPGNYQHLGLIPLMIPQARIIHMRRDPLDTCFSCFALHFANGHAYAYDQGALGRHYVRYHRLMAHWQDIMPAGSFLEVVYENLVRDTEAETRRILAYLGLDWHERCTRFHENRRIVRTASRAQVRQPIHSRSLGRWRRFEQHLMPLKRELAAVLSANVTCSTISPLGASGPQVRGPYAEKPSERAATEPSAASGRGSGA